MSETTRNNDDDSNTNETRRLHHHPAINVPKVSFVYWNTAVHTVTKLDPLRSTVGVRTNQILSVFDVLRDDEICRLIIVLRCGCVW